MSDEAEFKIVGPADKGEALATPPPSADQRYAVAFQLSGTPGRSWDGAFKEAYQAVTSRAKREARVSEDRITVFVAEDDDLQAVLDAVKQGVKGANDRLRRALAAQAEHKANQDAELQHRRDTVSRLQDELDDLQF
jgi:hypothetical protein